VRSLPRRLLVVALAYLALDLCLPSMPGAFVFDAGHCVESVRPGRSPDAAGIVTARAPAPAPVPRVLAMPDATGPRAVVVPSPLPRMPQRSGSGQRTATPEPAPLSEDSH
jgi:hypothetical protein